MPIPDAEAIADYRKVRDHETCVNAAVLYLGRAQLHHTSHGRRDVGRTSPQTKAGVQHTMCGGNFHIQKQRAGGELLVVNSIRIWEWISSRAMPSSRY